MNNENSPASPMPATACTTTAEGVAWGAASALARILALAWVGE